ncbi:MAG: hypothetical protein LBN24_06790 [Mediterranea sp.]|jgi:hypothetical protein|nr:hypothetical protein [Mediterranea sp.]
MKIKKIAYYAIAACLTLLWGSCSDEQDNGLRGPEGKMRVKLNMNVSQAVGNSDQNTRSLTGEQESNISSVYALAFTRNKNTNDEGTLTQVVQGDVKDGSNSSYDVSFDLNTEAGKEVNLVYIANAPSTVISACQALINKGETKEALYEAVTLSTSTQWTETELPMWAESPYEDMESDDDTQPEEVTMLRALARFDVGLGYNKNTGMFDDIDTKDHKYKLMAVYVLRVNDKARIAPRAANFDSDKVKVSSVSIPSTATVQHQGDIGSSDLGFKYETLPTDTTALTSTIYVPESINKANEATVLVLAITTDGNLGYYCVRNQTAKAEQKSVFRNYRYIFDVRSIAGEGQSDVISALHTTRSDMEYVVTEYDDNNDNLYMNGNYYVKVAQREVKIPSQGGVVDVDYETNLPKSLPITWAWDTPETTIPARKDSVTFAVTTPEMDSEGITRGHLTLSAPTNGLEVDTNIKLLFKAGGINGQITVVQPTVPMKYGITDVKVNGTYLPYKSAKDASDANYIELTLNNISEEDLGATWNIETENKFGLHFSGKGLLTNPGTQVVRIYPDDSIYPNTDTDTEPKPKLGNVTLAISSNSKVHATSTVTVPVAYRKMRLLCIGSGRYDSYAEGGQLDMYKTDGFRTYTGGSYYFLTSESNYGLSGEDDVFPVMDGDNEYKPEGSGPVRRKGLEEMACIRSDNLDVMVPDQGESPYYRNHQAVQLGYYPDTLKAILTGSNPPDIVIIGDTGYGNTTNGVGDAIKKYVDNKGVLLFFDPHTRGDGTNDNYDIFDGKATTTTTIGSITPRAFAISDPTGADDDPIISGKLDKHQYYGTNSDITGKMIGVDWTDNTYLEIKPEYVDDFKVYAKSTAFSGVGAVPIFVRYLKKNIVWIGDGGFLSNLSHDTGSAPGLDGTEPFAINSEWQPQERTGWNGGNGISKVHNSFIFRNIMAWAIYTAQYNGINSNTDGSYATK